LSVFIFRRFLTLIATLVGASLIIFLVLDALPGNAAADADGRGCLA
jgi:peptide/nickel transport system permease protein